MNLKKELPIIAIMLLPFLYLAYIWADLPNIVPIHWNLQGEVDGHGSKMYLILIIFLLPVFNYVIISLVPKIDPKKTLKKMGNKLYSLKFYLTAMLSILALFIINTAKNESFNNPNILILILGLIFIVFGNYFKTIQPNYFMGIRTPWTLENETVWKETHKLGGLLFFIGGLVIVLTSLVFESQTNFILLMIITLVIVVVTVLHSYLKYQTITQETR